MARDRRHGEASINQLKLIAAAAHRGTKDEVKSRNVVLERGARLLPHQHAFSDKEQFRLLFRDKRNQVIADEVQQTDTVDHEAAGRKCPLLPACGLSGISSVVDL